MPRRNRRRAGQTRPLPQGILDPYPQLREPKPKPKRQARLVPDDRADEEIDFETLFMGTAAALSADQRGEGRGAA